jgi:hypothetical protein
MAFHHGKDAHFMVNAVNLTTFLDSADLSQDGDVAETSTMGVEAKTFIPGLTSGKISLGGKYDPTAATGPDATINALMGSDTASTFEYGPQGSATGAVKYSGSGFFTGYDISAPVGGVVAFKASFQISGAITKGTFA